MFNLQPGDIVELSSQTLLKLSQDAPELFQRVMIHGAALATIHDISDAAVCVDLYGTPVQIALDREHPWRSVRLFQRKNDEKPLDEMPPMAEEELPQVDSPFAAAVGNLPAMLARMHQPEHEVPVRVRFAHTVFIQFIIIRYRHAPQEHISGEEWHREDTPSVRELDVPEQKLYEAALTTMVNWLGEARNGACGGLA